MKPIRKPIGRLFWLAISLSLVMLWASVSTIETRFALNMVHADNGNDPVIETISPNIVSMEDSREVVIRGRNFGAETKITLEGLIINDIQIISSTEIHLNVPVDAVPGSRVLSVLTREGIAQHELNVLSKKAVNLEVGEITTIAGGSAFIGDGGAAVNANLNAPSKVILDANGNLFIADGRAQRIRRVDATTGIVTTVAGGGNSLANGVIATIAKLFPTCLAVDKDGNLFFGDQFTGTVRRVDAITKVVTTVAGRPTTGNQLPNGDGGSALNANLGVALKDIALDSDGNLFIAGANRVRKVNAQTGIISTVAGKGVLEFTGDGGLAINAGIPGITGLTLDETGNLFIVAGGRVRKVDVQTGIINTVAGNGQASLDFDSRDGKLATDISLFTDQDSDVVVDNTGNLYIGEYLFGRVVRIDKQTNTVKNVAIKPLSNDSGACQELLLTGSLATNNNNQLYVVESSGRVRQVDLINDNSINVIGNIKVNLRANNGGDGDLASKATLGRPVKVTVDRQNNIYLADFGNGFIRRIDGQSGIITTIAGKGIDLCGKSQETNNIPALQAAIKPISLATDRLGNLFFSDNFQIKRVDVNSGVIITVAGRNPKTEEEAEMFTGDGGPATQALLGDIEGLAINDSGDLYIAALRNGSIGSVRKVDAQTGNISTIAGNGKSFSGDGGPATQAGISPLDIALDGKGNILIFDLDANNTSRIRRIDTRGIIETVAGNVAGQSFSGANGPAKSAGLGMVRSVTADTDGNIYIGAVALSRNEVANGAIPRALPRVWRVDAQSGLISILIDSLEGAYTGDGFNFNTASLVGYQDNGAVDLELDNLGNLLVLNSNDGSVAALRLVKLSNNSEVVSPVKISGFSLGKGSLNFTGQGFGTIGATAVINGIDVSSRIIGQSDDTLKLKGNRKKLNINRALNVITITNNRGEVGTYRFAYSKF